MKKLLIFLLLINICRIEAQIQQADPHWVINTTFSDEFNGSKKSIWNDITGTHWGSSIFVSSPDYITYKTENGRTFLRLVAKIINGQSYTGGIITGHGICCQSWNNSCCSSSLGYGYYEIDARVVQTPNIVSGIWPAFWTWHAQGYYPYWYEEIDIFEPDNCQVRRNEHEVGFHHLKNENFPDSDANHIKERGYKYNVDMSQWHKYAVEWLPERLVFYIDDVPFFDLSQTKGNVTPFHQNPFLHIDIQVGKPGQCPPNIINGILGYFDIDYFRYYKLNCDKNTVVNEILNFNTYYYAVKKSITLSSSTTIPFGSNVFLRATDFIELKNGFEVPLGAELFLGISPCENTLISKPVESIND